MQPNKRPRFTPLPGLPLPRLHVLDHRPGVAVALHKQVVAEPGLGGPDFVPRVPAGSFNRTVTRSFPSGQITPATIGMAPAPPTTPATGQSMFDIMRPAALASCRGRLRLHHARPANQGSAWAYRVSRSGCFRWFRSAQRDADTRPLYGPKSPDRPVGSWNHQLVLRVAMSALPPKADITEGYEKCPLMTQSGHRQINAVFFGKDAIIALLKACVPPSGI